MDWTQNAWNNFKTQPEIWFFYGFLSTSMLSARKVFFDYPVLGEFNEYTGIYLYLSDIFLGLTILTWLISILYNNSSIMSIYKPRTVSPQKESSTPIRMFPVEHPTGQAWNFLRGRRGTKIVLLGLPALLVLWSSITIFWSDQPEIATFRSFKLFEFYLLYLFLALNPHTKTPDEKHFGVGVNPKCFTPVRMFHARLDSRKQLVDARLGEHPTGQAWNILRNVFRIIIAIGVINAIISILQVILQHSLGLFWLNESLISPDLPSVAKIILGGAKYIRAYGLFPHPNILGGFLLLSILLTIVYRRLFHSSQNVPPRYECSTPASTRGNSSSTRGWWNILRGRHETIWRILLLLQAIGLIVTFSKSALVGLASALIYLIYIKKVPPQKECSTWNILRGRRETMEQLKLAKKGLFKACRYWEVFVTGLIFGVLALIFRSDLNSLFFQSLNERVLYFDIARKIILTNPLFGVGVGQFVVNMQAYTNQLLLDWQFQPVHNVFLLIWSELGLIGLSLFGWFLWKLFHVEHSCWGGTLGSEFSVKNIFKALLIGFFVIALFDHYLWDIQQGQIMLWIVLGFLTGTRLNT